MKEYIILSILLSLIAIWAGRFISKELRQIIEESSSEKELKP